MEWSAPPGGHARAVALSVVLGAGAASAALAAAASLAGPVAFGQPRWSALRGTDDPPPAPAPTAASAQDAVAERVLSLPGWVLPVLALFSLAVVAALAYRLLRPGNPRESARAGPADDRSAAAPPPSRLAAGRRVEREVARLRRAGGRGDPRDDVVRAWCAMEDAAAAAGVPRAATQTPTAFTSDVLTRLGVDDAAVTDLLRLYHRARFSTAAMPADSGHRALAATAAVAAGLRAADGAGSRSTAAAAAVPPDGRGRGRG